MLLRARIALCLEHFGFVRRRLTSESILEKTYQVVGGVNQNPRLRRRLDSGPWFRLASRF